MSGQKRRARIVYSQILLGALLFLSLTACGTGGASGSTGNDSSSSTASGNIATPTSATTTTATQTLTPSATTVPLTVTSVNMAVNPTSLSNYSCGTTVTVTYTATFNFPANNAGGQVAFQYTTDNGRGSSATTTLNVSPGEPDTTYQFTWSGSLPADHTAPEAGGVMISSPNSLNSQLLGPSGSCTSGAGSTPTTTATFQVSSVTVAASPSLSGQSCGSQFTETYTATFTIAPNSPGGQIVFTYSLNNGQSGSSTVTLNVAAGRTTKTYTFHWSGKLPADHTAPGVGIVLVTAPNPVTSTGGTPDGQCS